MTSSSSYPLPTATAESLGFSPPRLARIGAALRAEIAAGRLPGAVLAIARHGRLVCHEAFGWLDPQAEVPMPEDALFSIASMTKPLVAAAALSLYEEGCLLINEPVGRYLPQLAQMRVAAPGGSVPALRPMTIQDLMRHTAGLTYGNRGYALFEDNGLSSSDSVAERMSGDAFLQKLGALPLHFQPGSAWDYGFGFDVLGLAIEAIAGQPLAGFAHERLFEPLAMADTGFVAPPEKAGRYAKGFAKDPLTGKPQVMRDGTRRNQFDCGGGGAVSTAADYLRFAQMLLDGGVLDGRRVLGRKTVAFMTADHIGPEVDTTRLRAYPNINGYGFGLGVAVRRQTGIAPIMSSAGEFQWAGSTGPYFWVDPAEGLVVVFMAHAPGALRFYYRQMLHALVLQALA